MHVKKLSVKPAYRPVSAEQVCWYHYYQNRRINNNIPRETEVVRITPH